MTGLSGVIGKTCPYCQTPIKPGEAVVFCSACSIPHHRECWNEGRGCTTFGCNGNPAAEPSNRHGRNTIDIDINEFDSSSIPSGAEFRPDYYEILQVDRHASPEVITAAYRQLLSIYNPEQDGNKQRIKLIQDAYGVVGDSQDRWLYDSWLDNNSPLVENAFSTVQHNMTGMDIHITKKRLSVIDTYKFGFEMLVKQPGITLFLVMIILLSNIINLPLSYHIFDSIFTIFLVSIIGLIIYCFINSIVVRIILNMFDDREIEISNLTSVKIMVNLIIYCVVCFFIIVIGFVFFIIPGIILSIKLLPGFYLIIDEDLKAMKALKKSWNVTRGFAWKIFLFLLILILFGSFIGILEFILGINMFISSIITIAISPVLWYAQAFLYRTILSQWQTNVGTVENMRFNALNYSFPMLNNVTIAVMVIIIIVSSIIYAKIGKTSLEDIYQPDFQHSSINHNWYNS